MTRNSKTLKEFTEYCKAHPSERFWQALRNWADVPYVFFGETHEGKFVDTFYLEGRK